MKKLIFIAGLASIAVGASAQTLFWSGDTTGGPTFNRPGGMAVLAGSFANAVSYEVIPFWVTAGGNYVMELNGGPANGKTHTDTFALVYGAGWNAATPLTGLINGDDDFFSPNAFTLLSGIGQGFASSRIATGESGNFNAGGLALSASTQYYAVVTGFANVDFGTYLGAIGGGQGTVNRGIVPEPATMAALGLGALALIRRRRSK